MSLKFICPNCGTEVISKYLKSGDLMICRECNYEILVPADAAVTDDSSNILKRLKAESEEIKKFHYEEMAAKETSREISKEPTPWGIFSIFKFLIASLILTIVLSCFIGFLGIIIFVVLNPEISKRKEFFQNQSGGITTDMISFVIYIIAIGLIYYSVVKRHHHDFFKGLNIFKIPRKQLMKYIKIDV
jgi:DNA-directed RNA polymerase subunit RPC12/RpoP